MQTKTKKRPRRNALRDYRPRARPPAVVESLPPVKDSRSITIIGKDASGAVVAEDRHDAHWKAGQVAAGWKASGLEVTVSDSTAG